MEKLNIAKPVIVRPTMADLIQQNVDLLKEVKEMIQSKKITSATIEEQAREKITNFMLEHMNIPFINDDTEREIYNALLNILFEVINKFI